MYISKLIVFFSALYSTFSVAQSCCSGGSGSPIAGGASQGVLVKHQLELSGNYQYFGSGKFQTGTQDTSALLDYLFSNYLYGRVAFGLTKELTMSVESGYYINKTEYALHKRDTISSKGIGDLILFPRYNVFTNCGEKGNTELTLGLGYKIPLGSYNDSFAVYQNPVTLKKYYTAAPPTVQPTTGAQDIIFYGFFMQTVSKYDLKFFTNAIYIKKGWNPLGQKFGNYANVGLFVCRSFWNKLGVTLQLRGEWIDKMKYDKNIDMLALYNIDVNSTGCKKIFFVPQLNYTYKSLTIYALYEYPLYQKVNRVQIVSDVQFTSGLAYRFNFD
ncbi:MAG TPA: hypothetical protein PLU73_09965 [Bacteroidia bacterium]|nr:hypothetical protein [Bacteroidia bacterium]